MRKLLEWLDVKPCLKGTSLAAMSAVAFLTVGGATSGNIVAHAETNESLLQLAAATDGLVQTAELAGVARDGSDEIELAEALSDEETDSDGSTLSAVERRSARRGLALNTDISGDAEDDTDIDVTDEEAKEAALATVTVAPVPLAAPAELREKFANTMRFSEVQVTRASYKRELNCLATGLYFEARGETDDGQLAVAEVILNRVASKYYPNTICGVIYQGANRKSGCQFSFTCDGAPDIPRNAKAWAKIRNVAEMVLDGYDRTTLVGGATYYHADYVAPRWARAMTPVAKIGRHIFYEHVTSPRRL